MENFTWVLIFIEFIKWVGEWGMPSILSLFHFYIHLLGMFINSPEPLAHNELLWSLDVRRALSVVRHQQLLQRTSLPKLLAGFCQKLGRNDPHMALF